jgi:hypothetical protein
VPTAQAPFGGVPVDPFGNQRAIADPNRHALALRYLGGIFHDSSGESSYLDPEDLDQGWIPSAFGAVPPDAPTVQMARIPADLPLAASAPPRRSAAPAAPGPGAQLGRAGRRRHLGDPRAAGPRAPARTRRIPRRLALERPRHGSGRRTAARPPSSPRSGTASGARR